jgi:DNA polymerase-3 subunit gamma/tau
MIKPTLGYAKGISSPQGVVDQKADVETVVEEKYPDPIKLTSVDDLGSHWGSFVDKVKNEAPRMLYMQVLRVSLKELKGNKLVVTADNEFATNLFDENQQLLSNLMKRTVGIRIRIKCIVERQTKKKETKSPYERFKELQKKDPHLKTVVELFGAELDY